MVTNSLTKLLTSNPGVGEEISKLTTKEDIFAALEKHISGYTEEQMLKDFSEIKASAEIASGGELDAEALENVAGGATDWAQVIGLGLQVLTQTVQATVGAYGQYQASKQQDQ
ncbi:MAG: hypothetical protein LBI41_03590 [Lactobacillales bacterium]|nr:hypothetical protein [Lactobacillales bacterium]